jgi:hypothetical protein
VKFDETETGQVVPRFRFWKALPSTNGFELAQRKGKVGDIKVNLRRPLSLHKLMEFSWQVPGYRRERNVTPRSPASRV